MESLAIIPNIEQLLRTKSERKTKEALGMISDNIEVIGPLLKGTIPLLDPEEASGLQEEIHLVLSMIYFYTQDYDKCVAHAVLSSGTWFREQTQLLEKQGLNEFYFQNSMYRIISSYVHKQKSGERDEKLFRFVEGILEYEDELGYSLLGMLVSTRNIQALEGILKSRRDVLLSREGCARLEFLLAHSRNERMYNDVLAILCGIWEEHKEEDYALVFLKSVSDGFVLHKDDFRLVELLSQVLQKRKEDALFLAFFVHDKSPITGLRIVANIRDPHMARVLTGKFQSEHYQRFFVEHNRTDFTLLSELSKAQSSKSSMNHMALSFSNGIMNCNTGNDTYLRKNVEWMKQARNWSKFVVASSLGMIHTDSEDPFEILRHYLPMASLRDDAKDDPESGGSLLALGLICINTPSICDGFLGTFLDAELETNRPHILHGACLGLAIARIGTGDHETIERFKNVLYSDSVTISEAAAYSIGLVSAGVYDRSLVSELLTYAKGTDHEKITRAIGVGIALQLVGLSASRDFSSERNGNSRGPEAGEILVALASDKDSTLRYAGALSYGTAYVGTGDLEIVKRLLSIISIDNSEDVKRVAVLSIGLVMANSPEKLCDILEPLAQSHSPYVRAGVALTFGMFLAGSGDHKVLKIVEVLMYDTFGYVRQHASIGAGLLLMQLNVRENDLFKRVVEHMHTMTGRKSEAGAARFGALLGRSLMDASGRNGIFSIHGMAGDICLRRLCGAVMFAQYWYWYPLAPFVSLCIRPTVLLAVDTNLELVPNFSVTIDSPIAPFLDAPILPTDHKRTHRKFKTLSIPGSSKKSKSRSKNSVAKAPGPGDEEKAEAAGTRTHGQAQKRSPMDLNAPTHTIRNFERITTLQLKKSSLNGSPSVLFLPASNNSSGPSAQQAGNQ